MTADWEPVMLPPSRVKLCLFQYKVWFLLKIMIYEQ